MRGGSPRRDPSCPAPCPHPALQRRSGNTITVRPRRVAGGGPGGGGPGGGPGGDSGVAEGVAAPPEPPPGPPKKRYPTAEQIQVIGGYLALPRSCLAKSDPHRKKVPV
ncbi:TPRN protein, partial [Daphoenositta chrysoptera]|nr:TPRN protein [Daphoenositta chrysoptera]